MTHCKSTKKMNDCHFCASQNTDDCEDSSNDMFDYIEMLDNNRKARKAKNCNIVVGVPIQGTDEAPREMREFGTGATRDSSDGKLDFEGFLSPLVLERYAQYLDAHRVQADGNLRDSDNWQGGMPRSVYMKSMLRHVLDAWKEHRGYESREGLEDALCGVIFNAMGYLFEILHERSIDE